MLLSHHYPSFYLFLQRFNDLSPNVSCIKLYKSKLLYHFNQECAAHGCRRVRTPPVLENFQFFTAKIVCFIEKRKDHEIKKNLLCIVPLFEKLYANCFSSEKNFVAPLPTFFFAAYT